MPVDTGESTATSPQAAVFDLARRACEAYGRPDLAVVVDRSRHRHDQPHVRVVVVGEFKKGKSTLVNALVGDDVCATDDDLPTAIPTVVHHAAVEAAVAIVRTEDGVEGRTPIAREDLAGVMRGATSAGSPTFVEVGLPLRLLGLGLQVMDTPGVGGLVSAHAAATRAAAATADAVLFVTDALQELTGAELDALRGLLGKGNAAAIAMTKIDVAPAWREIRALDDRHLEAAGLTAEILPLAAPLRRRALDTRDAALNEESGYHRLVAWLTGLARSREVIVAGAARAELVGIVHQLEQPLATELLVIDDPERLRGLVAGLEVARERAQQLETSSHGWQQLLGDRVGDVNSAVEHDLRRRLREVGREADQRVADLDPADMWDEFEPWLRRRVADDVAAVLVDLQTRAAEVVDEVLERFVDEEDRAEAEVPVADQALTAPMTTLADLAIQQLGGEKAGLVATGLTALRGVQGGAMMFGMVGNMVGLAIAGPVLIGVGLVMGSRSLVEEQRRQLAARRQHARQSVRTYVDDVSFHVGKDVRDALRLLQRGLRDSLTERAATVKRTVTDALEAAEGTARQGRADADARRPDVEAELDRLRRLAQEIEAVFAVAGDRS